MNDFESQIARAKEGVERSMGDLLNVFSFVPDDKLTWSPSSTARSPLWIVGHCGQANEAFASFIRGVTPPLPGNPQDISKAIRETGRLTSSRDEAIASVESSVKSVLAALDGLTPESIEGSVDSPFGPMPIRFWMSLPEIHMTGHARQLDYLQTVWGDVKDHMVGMS